MLRSWPAVRHEGLASRRDVHVADAFSAPAVWILRYGRRVGEARQRVLGAAIFGSVPNLALRAGDMAEWENGMAGFVPELVSVKV